jgi:chromosome segregation ATPase
MSFVGLEAKQDSLQKSFVGLEAKQDSLQESFEGLETKFGGLEARQDSLQKSFVGLETKFEGLETKQDELHRYFGVIAEGLRSDIRQVAEGVNSVSERLDRYQAETAKEFAESRAMIRLSYSELDRRLRTLEDSLESLQSRVLRLESATAN